MKSLKLFNGVLAKKDDNTEPVIDVLGIMIEPSAVWAKDQILSYYEKEVLDGQDLNKTFHKSWNKIKGSTRFELLVHQILHYMTTYGTDFESDFIYIPTEKLDIPRVDINKLKFKVIRGYTRDELVEKSLNLLASGVALTEETIDDVLTLLYDELDYTFTGDEVVRNKEATIKLAETYGVLPSDPVEFLRYVIYRSTGETLLIKNDKLISMIKLSDFNATPLFKKYGLVRLAEIFNRFKPLFLAFKGNSRKTINKISKLSKKHHKPMVENPLNEVTSRMLKKDELHWLENATTFALLKAMNACYTRMEGQEHFIYNIRNGKSWATTDGSNKIKTWEKNYGLIMNELSNRLDLSGATVYIPENIEYAIPTSEKLFVGNIPMGTRIYGDNLAVGMYWENKWGARDLDLSAILSNGQRIGWNSRYKSSDKQVLYSGDLTSAPNGAVEYMYANNALEDSALINMNIFSGSLDCGYKIIVGDGDDMSRDYMMNPNNLIFQQKTNADQKQMILGVFLPEEETNRQSFIVLNIGSGSVPVSRISDTSTVGRKAIIEEWTKKVSLRTFITTFGGTVVSDPEEVNGDVIDLSIENLEKDTILNLITS